MWKQCGTSALTKRQQNIETLELDPQINGTLVYHKCGGISNYSGKDKFF